MTDFYEATAILADTRRAMRRADELIERALEVKSHPSAIADMAESCARLKSKLDDEIAELEKAIEIGGR